ncbi:hypothetical protein BYT27DRAFT_7192273 [Phlegmacium glaucopus]|nr:hypothetical protein BYT27DRAFT_7192273 [Phlegmacium glaucopus]
MWTANAKKGNELVHAACVCHDGLHRQYSLYSYTCLSAATNTNAVYKAIHRPFEDECNSASDERTRKNWMEPKKRKPSRM